MKQHECGGCIFYKGTKCSKDHPAKSIKLITNCPFAGKKLKKL